MSKKKSKENIALINRALAAPYATLYWWADDGVFSEAYVNAENSGMFTPATDGGYLTGLHRYVQVERDDGSVAKYGSYSEKRGEQVTRVGDGTNASLQLRKRDVILVQENENGELLQEVPLCSVTQIVGLSILEKYGQPHQNYRLDQ